MSFSGIKVTFSPACLYNMLARRRAFFTDFVSWHVFLYRIRLLIIILLPINSSAAIEIDNGFHKVKTRISTSSTDKAASRIISLDLCTDWMLAKYAQRSQVLALSPFIHEYPVDWVGHDWPTHSGNLEQILELKPDLVITGEYNALILRGRLQELGIRVEILPLPQSLSQLNDYEKHFLSLLGLPTTNLASNPVKAIVNSTAHSRPRLLLLGANGIGTGQNTFEDGILKRSGWDNYIETNGYINLDLEQIAVNPPDAVLWSAPNSAALANLFVKHPVLKRVIPNHRWLKTDIWRWQCPGPWTWNLIEQLQQSLPGHIVKNSNNQDE